MHLAGYIASLLIGLSLGLIGGGGSILTVPVMVYLFGLAPSLATSYSLFIVGATSLAGAAGSYIKGHVNLRISFLFGLSSISTVFITRRLIIPAVPVVFGHIGGFAVTEAFTTMVLFALLMILSAFSMVHRKETDVAVSRTAPVRLRALIIYGILIGLVTGLLGAGGGFLLIPALVLLVRLPMKEAVGTSLFIIALNSLIGFMGDIGHFQVDPSFLFTVTLIAIAGILAGGMLSNKIAADKLKKGFGWFVLVMGGCILVKEIFFSR